VDAPITKNDETADDPTEDIRRQLALVINASPRSRDVLESEFGPVLDPTELARQFEVLGFRAPFVVVRRNSDQQLGSFLFQHHPRFYFSFVAN
jgi:hypothetical protein